MAERPEDLNLPSAVVSRIIKEALPQNVKVSKEAQAAVAKAAKTIHGTDVIKAMEDMEFDKFIKPLEGSLDSFKGSQQRKKDDAKAKRESKQKTAPKDDDDDDDDCEVIEVDPNDQSNENNKETTTTEAANKSDDDDDDDIQECSP